MSETLSIRERIEIRLAELVAGITGIGTVHRFDPRNAAEYPHLDALVELDGEEAAEGPLGNVGYTEKRLALYAYVIIRVPEGEALCPAFVHNRWVAALELAVLADPQFVEPATGKRLLYDEARVTGITAAPREAGQREVIAGVAFEAVYRHDRDNPYQLSTLIPARTVTTLPTWCTTGTG